MPNNCFPNSFRYYMKSHKLSHTDPALRTCKFCNIVMNSVIRLDEHISLVHTVDYTPCTMCDKTFVNKGRLHRHIRRRHTGPARLPCEICGRVFSGNYFLKYHILKRHNPDFAHSCGDCFSRFDSEVKLRFHVLRCVHKQPTALEAPKVEPGEQLNEMQKPSVSASLDVTGYWCKYTYFDSFAWYLCFPDIAKRSKKAQYECIYCKGKFPSLEKLERHLNYNGPEIKRCIKCNRNFPSGFCLIRHINSVHLAKDPLQCSLCPGTYFTSLLNWIHHRRSKHLIFECNECDMNFKSL